MAWPSSFSLRVVRWRTTYSPKQSACRRTQAGPSAFRLLDGQSHRRRRSAVCTIFDQASSGGANCSCVFGTSKGIAIIHPISGSCLTLFVWRWQALVWGRGITSDPMHPTILAFAHKPSGKLCCTQIDSTVILLAGKRGEG